MTEPKLTKEQELLEKYFAACANFYYVIPLKQIYKIIKIHGELTISKEDFYAYASKRREEKSEHNYWGIFGPEEWYEDEEKSRIEDCEIVTDWLFTVFEEDEEPEYYEFIDQQRDCPWYIPNFEEIMKYSNVFYEGKNSYIDKAVDFIKQNLELTEIKEENVSDGLAMWIKMSMGNPVEDVMDFLETEGVVFNKKQTEIFIPFLIEAYFNTRLPLLHGFTPNELHQIE